MNPEKLWQEILALPPHLREQVFDFVRFLQTRYGIKEQNGAEGQQESKAVAGDFIGMWRDRTDMADSTQWVRNLRTQEQE